MLNVRLSAAPAPMAASRSHVHDDPVLRAPRLARMPAQHNNANQPGILIAMHHTPYPASCKPCTGGALDLQCPLKFPLGAQLNCLSPPWPSMAHDVVRIACAHPFCDTRASAARSSNRVECAVAADNVG
ncbi:hypothetical protein COCC4DRAFT_145412 [Bipolaris maydis ATCC 48331]|uniref:Uncharacterized protein n=2 Tax=Cochliobolus heterostrophus TaxID=5016 RepID=M2UVW2_COCH5|nr:uncharacterized protein COCC4DRAFT_145412 [Bipolaris maydis ATCC 48331]EMD91978.1 hypothetical protein COCHEDRAFT_1029503 [Bipolaris maydis C5]ENI02538.1 hypothetical protein COCC4DRAFT_145412 [Bipolaris maydis ATCC 48331]